MEALPDAEGLLSLTDGRGELLSFGERDIEMDLNAELLTELVDDELLETEGEPVEEADARELGKVVAEWLADADADTDAETEAENIASGV